jgi:hypothetical protein
MALKQRPRTPIARPLAWAIYLLNFSRLRRGDLFG